jgi:predicted thioesterase
MAGVAPVGEGRAVLVEVGVGVGSDVEAVDPVGVAVKVDCGSGVEAGGGLGACWPLQAAWVDAAASTSRRERGIDGIVGPRERGRGAPGVAFGLQTRRLTMALDASMVGQVETGSVVAGPEHYASGVFSGAPDVFSTPALGALIEATAAGWMARNLEAGQMSVGTQIVINHTAATPPGLAVTVEARVTAIEGRRVEFEWTARDEREQVGHGTHQRFVIDAARFMANVEKKSAG